MRVEELRKMIENMDDNNEVIFFEQRRDRDGWPMSVKVNVVRVEEKKVEEK